MSDFLLQPDSKEHKCSSFLEGLHGVLSGVVGDALDDEGLERGLLSLEG